MNGSYKIAFFCFILGVALAIGCSEEAVEEVAPLQETVSNVGILAERLEKSIAEAEALQDDLLAQREALSQDLAALKTNVGESENRLAALQTTIGKSDAALSNLRGDLNELLKITAGPAGDAGAEAGESTAALNAEEDDTSGAARALGIAFAVLIIAGVIYAVIMIRNRLEESEPGSFGAKWSGAPPESAGRPENEEQSEYGSIRFFAGRDGEEKDDSKNDG
jgi:hypothetical protein